MYIKDYIMTETIDELTGLLNRAALIEKLEAATREEGPLVLVFMDLDHLLTFNDRYGHQAGDEWIRANGQLFGDAFGAHGMAGRYGGDEFIAVLREGDLFAVYETAEQLRRQVESEGPTVIIDGQPTRPGYTISIGLADFPTNATDATDLIRKGKEALMRAKTAGSNQVCFYEETDSLTGVLNLPASQRALDQALATARQKRESLSVFMIDIDRFKELNDQHGHRAGDEVLRRLAHILQNNFKEVGTVGRITGDSFIVIMPGLRADSAFVLAEEVRRLVEDSTLQVTIGPNTYTLGFRITGGVATFPGDGAERVDLLRKADEALYRAKQTGRNRICLPASSQMVTKTSHFTQTQLERLAALARAMDKTEAFLLREALDDLLRKYGEGLE
jgi:diguanylate cyclase